MSGPYTSTADRDLAHRLWRNLLERKKPGMTLHEGEIFGIALRRLEQDLGSTDSKAADEIQREILLHNSTTDAESPKILQDPA